MSRARILTFANQKGGVGKTTATHNVACILAKRGFRVLAVDLDHQGNLTDGFGIDPATIDDNATIYPALKNPTRGCDYLIQPTQSGVDLLASTPTLAVAEIDLIAAVSRETILKRILLPVADRYNYILIDCPPSLGVFTLNALTAADTVFVPLQVGYYPFKMLEPMLNTIQLVGENTNPHLDLGGIFFSFYDPQLLLSQAVMSQAQRLYGPQIMQTRIPISVRVAEAPGLSQSVAEYAPKSTAAAAYDALATEILSRMRIDNGTQ